MKKVLLTSIILFAASSIIWSQKFGFDIRIGMSPAAHPVTADLIVGRENPHNEFLFNLVRVEPQFYGGLRVHKQLKAPFFLEGGLTYTRRTSQYQVNYRMPQTEPGSQHLIMKESEDILQLPLEIGVSLGRIDVTSGLTIMKTLSSQNELTHLNGFSAENNTLKWGWQMGVRYGIKRVMAGIEYQGSMQRVCQGMYVNEKPLEIMNVPGRFVFSLQYRF